MMRKRINEHKAGEKKYNGVLKRRVLAYEIRHILFDIILWLSPLIYLTNQLMLNKDSSLIIYGACLTIIIIKRVISGFKSYKNDKKSKLREIEIKFVRAKKSEEVNKIRYEIINLLCYSDKVAVKAEIKSGLGYEFIIPFVLTCIITCFNIAVANKEFITYSPIQYKVAEQRLITEMISNKMTKEEINDKFEKMLDDYRSQRVKEYLSAVNALFMIGILGILLSSIGFINQNRLNKSILTYLEEVK
ncbi:hypothetical protein [Anaerocolumna chitinilytica]|uniref:Uncharacterized protein n=1 Tax=Anaerocolumna chitinilytica TaxID=1727145 RepID=A0A7I8DLE8_9FIRM|nr:hypothetical protein [Anaerocolumna chitinilytica]BCJ98134.1 hypothetical protein bsdcttw_11750 [Anaerocolumna chitinilytica]